MKKTNLMFALISIAALLAICTGCSEDSSSDENTDGGVDTSTNDTNGDTGTGDDVVACTWSTFFEDNFDRADGPLGDNYMVQVMPETDVVAIANNAVAVNGVAYYAISYTGETTQLGVRVGVDFSYSILEENADQPMLGLMMTGTSDSKGYYCGANLKAGLAISSWEPSEADPHGITTILAESPVSFEENTVYAIECSYNQGNYTARLLTDTGTEVASIAATDTTPVAQAVGINGGDTSSISTQYDNLIIEVCQ